MSGEEKGNWFGSRKIVRLMLLAALLILGVLNFGRLCAAARFLWHVMQPLALGAVMAYVLEIVVKYLEGVYFPKSSAAFVLKSRRMVCVLLAAALLIAVMALLFWMVIPGLADAVGLLTRELPAYIEQGQLWLIENTAAFPGVSDALKEMRFDWEAIQQSIVNYAVNGLSGILSSTVSVIGAVTGGLASFFMSLIFAVLLLTGKKRLHAQYVRIMALIPRQDLAARFHHVMTVAHRAFSGFIMGQTLDALLLGVFTTLGMVAFGMPYAMIVGVLSGTTALIPLVGGYIGAIVGAFLVFTVSPMQALWFLLFIIVLQQVFGNLVYPRLVGSSIGLPGMWVLAAVTVGGGLGGVGGMLLGVPVMATIYALAREKVQEREALRRA